MEEVKKEIYLKHFDEIFNWFEKKVHASPQCYNYSVIELKGTHLKLIELSDENDKVFFRVLIKATYEDVKQPRQLIKNYQEIGYLTNTISTKPLLAAGQTALQVCYVQLNDKNIPVNGVLYTYAKGQLHKFDLGIDGAHDVIK